MKQRFIHDPAIMELHDKLRRNPEEETQLFTIGNRIRILKNGRVIRYYELIGSEIREGKTLKALRAAK
jgi:hypothetical protein